MNTDFSVNPELKKNGKLMNNAILMMNNAMENVRKHGDIKLVTTKTRRNYLVSEINYQTTKFFPKNLLAIEMKKTQIFSE